MARPKYIQVSPRFFENENVQLIEAMPGGNKILVIWFKLLCLADRNLQVAHSNDELSTFLNRPVPVVQMALYALEQYGLLSIDDAGTITLLPPTT